MKTPKQYVTEYLNNMFDNQSNDSFDSFEEFFVAARFGAHDWANDESWENDHKFLSKILRMSCSGFGDSRKLFNSRHNPSETRLIRKVTK